MWACSQSLGVIKLYKLTYEPVHVQHAIFDRSKATNEWSIEPKYLKEITDHFGPSAEHLDIYSEQGKAVFTSFTTKSSDGKEILRQPVHTSVAIEKRDFDYYLAEDHLHVAIHMKDFKAAIAHAETANAKITARFTRPSRPLQFAYESEGVKTEFTLMTRGESPGEDVPGSSRAAPQLSARQTPAPVQISQRNTAPETAQMPPPRSRSIRPLTGTSTRASQSNTETQQPPPSMEFDSLFVPADDDRQWDVPNDEDEGPVEDELGWDATGEQTSTGPGLRDIEPRMAQASHEEEEMGIPPTQRMSQHDYLRPQSRVITQLVAQPAPSPTTSPTPSGKGTALHTPFTFPCASVTGPQLPCSPQPQATTVLMSTRASTCSLPTANSFTTPISPGGNCPRSFLPQLTTLPSEQCSSTPDITPHLSPGDPSTTNSPFSLSPTTTVNSLPHAAPVARNPISSSSSILTGSHTILDSFPFAPNWPFLPPPHPYTCPPASTTTVCPIPLAILTTFSSNSMHPTPSRQDFPSPRPNSPLPPVPKTYTFLPATRNVASHVADTFVNLSSSPTPSPPSPYDPLTTTLRNLTTSLSPSRFPVGNPHRPSSFHPAAYTLPSENSIRVWFPPAAMRDIVAVFDEDGEEGEDEDEKAVKGWSSSKRHSVGMETSSVCARPSWPEPLEPKA
ncbi:uncharacterized protein An02g02490 [Aspergillus niger]|uniref:Contig An02c0060, genomic contig n=2 Tax=Aspergillus niger TaxID=5061 RepID=A2QC70_ASPNC|nr:uncharacterized protein An02g02490 [Aspergillus niger]CAK37530.1 unnamed protein product [Aspergillus niger]